MRERHIEYVRRSTGETEREEILAKDLMELAYGTRLGVLFSGTVFARKLVSDLLGAYNDSLASTGRIEPFVRRLSIDASESAQPMDSYRSFNEFFARKLRPGARPTDPNPQAFTSPGDGRLLVFPRLDQETLSYVKWAPVRLFDLFASQKKLVERYAGGSAGVLRLSPGDYHRFHFPAGGLVSPCTTVPGLLHSVSPYALEQGIPVFALNKRTLTTLRTESHGKILLMEVGAMFVGSIVQTYRTGATIKKGDEKGFFKFGGSTVVFFAEPGVLTFDRDLVDNTSQGLETLVRTGEAIGRLR